VAVTPLLSACLIVKNEETFLPGCLASLAGLADEIVVVDTGSTDGSVAIARAHGAVLLEHEWRGDYAKARNVGLARATGRFILYIDADEEVFAEDRAPLREVIAGDGCDAILMRLVSPLFGTDKTAIDVYPRVFRNYPGVRFRFRIHEQIWPSLAPHRPRVLDGSFRILHHGYNQAKEILDKKRERNLDIALKVLADEPDDGFYLYQAGFACLTLGRLDEGLAWLERALRFTDPGPARVPILNAIAQAHYDAKRRELAVKAAEESTSVCADQFHGWALLADIHLQQQRHDRAMVALERCLAVKTSAINSDVTPSRAVLSLKLGLSQLLTHHPIEAQSTLARAIALGLEPDQRAMAERYLALADKMSRGAKDAAK
jgi:tetratricopeptide (TPR) repeat protein